MTYSDLPAIDTVYRLVAKLAAPENPGDAHLDDAMTIAASLAVLGEDESWASVWWAYGALHYELSDEALVSALELLDRVTRPPEARAAALMLIAEIKYAQAVYADSEPSPAEQHELLGEAVLLAPDWPGLRLRLARASMAVGDHGGARRHAEESLARLSGDKTDDPFDSAITGRNLDRAFVVQELMALGLGVS